MEHQTDNSKLVDELLTLRRRLADPSFLREQFYHHDESKFAGSTYKYFSRVIRSDSHESFARLCDSPQSEQILAAHFSRLPDELCRFVDVPSDTPPFDSVSVATQTGNRQLEWCMRGETNYTYTFVNINRIIRGLNSTPSAASSEEAAALLANYHDLLFRKARLRWPEIWTPSEGKMTFDSRGIAFAKSFVDATLAAGFLTSKSNFLDVGSGIGTMTCAVNLWSQARCAGIELHWGLHKLSNTLLHRLSAKTSLTSNAITLINSDFRDCAQVIGNASLIYLYSPIGDSEISIDGIIERMSPGALLIADRTPHELLDQVQFLPKQLDLFTMRRVE